MPKGARPVMTGGWWFLVFLPSGYVKIAIENGPVEIVDLPMKNGDFPVRKL